MKEKYPLFQVIDENGNMTNDKYNIDITEENVKWFYYNMLRIRTYDRKGVSLQRQGRIGTYVPLYGQEASQVGSALALAVDDWMFPTYRDHGASLTFGADMDRMLLHWNGRLEGCLPSRDKRIMPGSIPIATHLPHAVGVAMAETYKHEQNVSIAYFGDGATSEGDFHEGLNIGSVFKAPVVFFNQNNGFAISTPVEKQMNSETIAQKATAYDIPGIRVDGMDVFGVYAAVKEAIERARNGGGPTLVESVTWRFGAHTTADDPSKYRDQEQTEHYQNNLDPLTRLERYMERHDLWDAQWIENIEHAIQQEIDEAVENMRTYPKANVTDIFDHVFEEPPWPIAEQRKNLMGTGGGYIS